MEAVLETLCGEKDSLTTSRRTVYKQAFVSGVEWAGRCCSLPSHWELGGQEAYLLGHTYSEWNFSHTEVGVVG